MEAAASTFADRPIRLILEGQKTRGVWVLGEWNLALGSKTVAQYFSSSCSPLEALEHHLLGVQPSKKPGVETTRCNETPPTGVGWGVWYVCWEVANGDFVVKKLCICVS